ncbi:MAG: glycosyltransferase family 2 protein [candidate division Zixibacteria bacterium]|nr:glycosyltransferase family 2 protein [candidate division Zixibacteria bacterium]
MLENIKGNNFSISVVVPAYNEEENLPPLLENFARMFKESSLNGEVIIVDDGSTDKTLELAKKFGGKYSFLKVLSNKTHRGVTAALQTGFKNATGDVYLFWPADLQYLPEDIPKLIQKVKEGNDIVTGWKKGRYGMKAFVSFFYNLLSRYLFNVKVHDLNSVKAFRKEVLKELPLRKDWHRYMVVMAVEKGFKIDEVKIPLYPRKYGKSKFGFWRIPIGVLDLFSVKFQISFMRKPMLFFGSIGLVLLFIGFLAGLVALYLRIFQHEGLRPLLYLVILLILSGISLFGLGFLAESITNLKQDIEELKDKFKE